MREFEFLVSLGACPLSWELHACTEGLGNTYQSTTLSGLGFGLNDLHEIVDFLADIVAIEMR